MRRLYPLFALLLLAAGALRATAATDTADGTPAAPPSVWPQRDWQFRNLNVSHGLPNNLSWRVQSLDDRTLLVVCDNTFALYDGARFRPCPYDFGRRYRVTTYSNAASYVDAQRRVWIKNYVNLVLFDQRQGRFVYAIDSLFRAVGVSGRVADFFLDTDREAWLLTTDGRLFLSDLSQATARRVQPLSRGAEARLVGVAQAGRECLLLYSDGHIDYYDKRRHRVTRSEQRFGGTDPYAEYCYTPWGDHAVVVGTARPGGGLWLYDSNTREWTRFYDRLHGYTRLLPTPQGGLLAVNPWGLAAFDRHLQLENEQNELHTELGQYLNRDLLDATFDWQGGLWLSSYRYGLFYTHPLLPQLSRLDVSAQSFDGMFMGADRQGHVYATQDGTLWSLDGTEPQRHERYRADVTALSLLATDADGRLYVRSRDRLLVFGPDGRLSASLDASSVSGMDGLPHVLVPLPDGRLFVCLGRERAGWFSLTERQFHACPLPDGFVSRYRDVRFLRYDAEARRVVLGGKFGIFYYDLAARRYAHFFPHGSDFGGHVLCCNDYLRDSQGRQWFATNAGLFLLAPKQSTDSLVRLTTAHGLLDDCAHALTEDPQGRLWVLTSTGLTALQGSDRTPLSPDSLTLRRYSLKRLTDGGEFADRCLFFAQNALWCGSTNGIVRVATASLAQSLPPLRVRLSEVVLQDEPATPDGLWRGQPVADLSHQELTLPHGVRSLTLFFSACDYLHAGETTFRYWLDDEAPRLRQTTGDLRLDYPTLASGRYRLSVQAQEADGSWSEPLVWTILVPAPWWCTWWAVALYVLLAAALVMAGRYAWRRWTWLQNQLHERRHKMMVQASEVKPAELRIKSRDQQFLQQAVADVEAHMADETFSVEQLSADMALTRTGLYRRLQAICGQSPVEFIRTIRLRRAEQLLRESGLNVEEIAREVGFRSTRNFSATFKQAYGKTPTEYRKADKDACGS